MKNKVILIITMLLVIVCTIIIYTLLFEEQNKLFYINVGIACLAEIILLANIPILSNEKLLTIKNVSLSVSLNLFAIVIFLWTAGCSLLMDQDSNLKTLYIGLLVITIIFFIINGATVIMAGGVTEKKALDIQSTIAEDKARNILDEALKAAETKKRETLLEVKEESLRTKNELENINSDWKDKTLQSFKIVLDKISMIPAYKLDRHSEIVNELTEKLNEIHELFQKVAGSPEQGELQSHTTLKINQLRNYVQTIKSTL